MFTPSIEKVFDLSNINECLDATSAISGVKSFNKCVKVDASVWKECLALIEEACAVKWVILYPYSRTRNIINNAAISLPKKKTRKKRVVFSQTYTCHRAGKYISVAKSDARMIQKPSKKCGCIARLKVICYAKSPSIYVFSPIDGHTSHIPGAVKDDLRTLPLPRDITREIDIHIINNPTKTPRQIKLDVQKKVENSQDLSQTHSRSISYYDVWNCMKKTIKKVYIHDNNDLKSLQIWMNEKLPAKNYIIFKGDLSQYNENHSVERFAYGFISPRQKALLESSRTFFLDATYGISTRKSDMLYSLVVRDSSTNYGSPVAFMLTNVSTIGPLLEWLKFFKSNALIVNPQQFTIDCSQMEKTAILNTFPNCGIQFCIFHVLRVWRRHLDLLWPNKVNIISEVSAEERKQNEFTESKNLIMNELQLLLFEDNLIAFHRRVEYFLDKYSSGCEKFVDYLKISWFNENSYTLWSCAHRSPDLFYMRTNNYVESWHNQLKSVYFLGRKNRRLDRLVHVLANEFEFISMKETKRTLENTGAMNSFQKIKRRKEIVEAASITQ